MSIHDQLAGLSIGGLAVVAGKFFVLRGPAVPPVVGWKMSVYPYAGYGLMAFGVCVALSAIVSVERSRRSGRWRWQRAKATMMTSLSAVVGLLILSVLVPWPLVVDYLVFIAISVFAVGGTCSLLLYMVPDHH